MCYVGCNLLSCSLMQLHLLHKIIFFTREFDSPEIYVCMLVLRYVSKIQHLHTQSSLSPKVPIVIHALVNLAQFSTTFRRINVKLLTNSISYVFQILFITLLKNISMYHTFEIEKLYVVVVEKFNPLDFCHNNDDHIVVVRSTQKVATWNFREIFILQDDVTIPMTSFVPQTISCINIFIDTMCIPSKL